MRKFDLFVACGLTAVVGMGIGVHLDEQQAREVPQQVDTVEVVEPIQVEAEPVKPNLEQHARNILTPENVLIEKATNWMDEATSTVTWHDSLAAALAHQDSHGGLLAIIIGADNCEPCERRRLEAKKLRNSPFDWVYCKNDDPAIGSIQLGERFPVFAVRIDDQLNLNIKPETIGLKSDEVFAKENSK